MNTRFTTLGIIVAGVSIWVFSQQATGESRSVWNLLLFVLLLSMVLLNWGKIGPLFFKSTP